MAPDLSGPVVVIQGVYVQHWYSTGCLYMTCLVLGVPCEGLVYDHVVEGVDVGVSPGGDPRHHLVHQHPQAPPVHARPVA